MISGERDGKLTATRRFEVDRAASSVVAVHPHAVGQRQADRIENRGDGPRYGADVRLVLADVMNKSCLDCPRVIGKGCPHATSNINGVPLIGRTLGPEQLGTTAVEVFADETLILWTRRFGTKVSEEATDEMASPVEATGHDAALHSTQRRAAGRYWMRSKPICSPQVSQIP